MNMLAPVEDNLSPTTKSFLSEGQTWSRTTGSADSMVNVPNFKWGT